MKILRRWGSTPRQRGSLSGQTCPDVLETDTGDIAIIGTASLDEVRDLLPDDAQLGPDAQLIIIPRELLIHALPDIPKE